MAGPAGRWHEWRRAVPRLPARAAGPVAAAGIGAVAAVGVPAGDPGRSPFVGLAVAVLASVSCLVGGQRSSAGVRLGWRLLAVAVLLWGVALVVGRHWPEAELTWFGVRLVAYAAICTGLYAAPGVQRPLREWALLLLDGFLVAGSLLITYLQVVVEPSGSGLAVVSEARLPLVFVVLDLIATSVVFGLAQRTDRADVVPVFVMVAGAALGATADLLHVLAQPGGGLPLGAVVLWTAGIAAIGIGPWSGRLDVFASAAPGRRPPSMARLPHLLLAVACVVGIVRILGGRPVDLLVSAVGAALLFSLAAQMALLQRENRRLYDSMAAQAGRFRAMLQGSSDVIITCRVDGSMTYVSPAMQRVFGHDPDSLLGGNLLDLVHPDDVAHVTDAIPRVVAGEALPARLGGRFLDASGAWRHAESSVNTFADEGRISLILNMRDVTERVELEEELRRRASQDQLTGLLNRSTFTAALQQRLAAPPDAECVAVLFIDLDDFKSVNDTAGHAVGDALLLEVARRLGGVLRARDVVARFGGDEFVALVAGESEEEVHAAAERLRTALTAPFVVAGRQVVTHASVGVAMVAPGTSAEVVLRNADLAMYHAKDAGRDRTAFYQPEMHAEAVRRVDVAARLRRAIDDEALTLHYQPVVDLSNGRVWRVEALLRWQLDDGSYVAPAEFVPVAEESGLIVPLGRWVLRRAIRQLADWRAAGLDIGVAVNLSARQLDDAGLVDDVATALAWTGAPAASVMLEVTENVLVDTLARSSGRLRDMRALGVEIALDDFGTGFSSLAYLSRLSVDVLKVDRSFVSALDEASDAAVLVRTMQNLAADLGLMAVAEGVETDAQLAAVRALGYPYAQGFRLARPMPAEAVEACVTRGFGRVLGVEPLADRAAG